MQLYTSGPRTLLRHSKKRRHLNNAGDKHDVRVSLILKSFVARI